MSRMMVVSTPKIKPVRRTPRPAAPFGQGILPARRERFEPSAADRAWAAQVFSADGDWAGRLASGLETCECCGRPVERGGLVGGLCGVCETRALDASMASMYLGAGLAYASH